MLTFPNVTEREGRTRSGCKVSVWPAGRERGMAALAQPFYFKSKVTERHSLSFLHNTRADPSTDQTDPRALGHSEKPADQSHHCLGFWG